MKCVLKSKKGEVLLYTLILVNVVTQWVLYKLMQYTDTANGIKSLGLIHERLDIEAAVIAHFREFNDDFLADLEGYSVEARQIDQKIMVSVNGKMSYRFEYVIMEDESFILNTTEENYDFIK